MRCSTYSASVDVGAVDIPASAGSSRPLRTPSSRNASIVVGADINPTFGTTEAQLAAGFGIKSNSLRGEPSRHGPRSRERAGAVFLDELAPHMNFGTKASEIPVSCRDFSRLPKKRLRP